MEVAAQAGVDFLVMTRGHLLHGFGEISAHLDRSLVKVRGFFLKKKKKTLLYIICGGFLGGSVVKTLPAVQEIQVRSLV